MNEPFTPEWIKAQLALAEKATVRPWNAWESPAGIQCVNVEMPGEFTVCSCKRSAANADYIVAAANNYPLALAEIERLTAEVAELETYTDKLNKIIDDDQEYHAQEVQQFNDGYTAFKDGKSETDAPHYEIDHDEWLVGYSWAAYDHLKAELAQLRVAQEWTYIDDGGYPTLNSVGWSDDVQLAYKVVDGKFRGQQRVSRYYRNSKTGEYDWEFDYSHTLSMMGYEAYAWRPLPAAPAKGG